MAFVDQMTPSWVEDRFNYHAPTPEQVAAMEKIRDACKALALVIISEIPSCADRTLAMRLVEDTRMKANQAVIFNT